ncbi:EamA family transporter [Rhizobium sp. FKL33]|uniref:aromatic amino acid exporter YddG n=1 Tax=Rhizobium sp. FKL33 TaxID=2562307 RepID=UPI0010C1458B|nr:EamA family transporter [Rhizobium sp. FKL33]
MTRATLIGFSAILMWSLLALMTAASGKMPPFQMNAVCFAIGALPGLILFAVKPERMKLLRQPTPVWILGIVGLFGYHFLYFTALRNAPAADASMIAYLWPLFIVLGSAMLPGEKLKAVHILGALAGLAGAVLIVSARSTDGAASFSEGQLMIGYGAALACAFFWSGYSLISRKFGSAPTDVVTGFCLATSLLSLVCHLALETTVWPETATEWLAVVGLGLLPVGAAFYTWDYGVKKGNIQILGVASYSAPVLSTLVLIVAGFTEPSWRILIACLLVTGGALIAVSGSLLGKKQPA